MNTSNGTENGHFQFDGVEDNRQLFGEMSITQYKAMQKQSRVMLVILIAATVLLIVISAGLVAVHITNADLRDDLELTKIIAGNLSSTLADVQLKLGNEEPSPAYYQGFKADSPSTTGAVYTRWGNSTCSSTAELVYDGFVGGSYYSHTGGAAQYLCLPNVPIYGKVTASQHSYRSTIYSTELQWPGFAPLDHLQHQDAACSVCRTLNSRVSVLMVPAQNVCPVGWTEEYTGYLMSASQEYQRTEFVCVDSNPSLLRNGARDENGALLYPVEARCDQANLPCPPYVDGYELSCAVCSK